jgi:Cytochrome oxidase complex assembly protein 1
VDPDNRLPEQGRVSKRTFRVGCGCPALALLICAFILFVFTLIKQSQPYKDAVALATNSAAVQAELGQPIQADFLVWGSAKTYGDSGYANLTFPIHGPKGTAKVHCVSRLARGQWNQEECTVTIDHDGKAISLNPTSW